jgi:hypothetical protein
MPFGQANMHRQIGGNQGSTGSIGEADCTDGKKRSSKHGGGDKRGKSRAGKKTCASGIGERKGEDQALSRFLKKETAGKEKEPGKDAA